ncbi:hypothetical protein PFTANZ_03915 [Plasmodium falciparum Tanzania (2000708)]|uniref:Uncharacterized protein n=1 Tax=Plasmodium falciparum Tanzania (2000708) TaxID=1036725 RepID=A0A024W4H1_PLAFA|nr:hypothetical protein PFTANZ_03915 [Plasmodium falciparum Tanzania (2000708)]
MVSDTKSEDSNISKKYVYGEDLENIKNDNSTTNDKINDEENIIDMKKETNENISHLNYNEACPNSIIEKGHDNAMIHIKIYLFPEMKTVFIIFQKIVINMIKIIFQISTWMKWKVVLKTKLMKQNLMIAK